MSQRGHSDYREEEQDTRPCILCGLRPTSRGHDPCIADLPDVIFACCGHGVATASYICADGIVRADPEEDSRLVWSSGCYVVFKDGVTLYGYAAHAAMEMLGGCPPPIPELVREEAMA